MKPQSKVLLVSFFYTNGNDSGLAHHTTVLHEETNLAFEYNLNTLINQVKASGPFEKVVILNIIDLSRL